MRHLILTLLLIFSAGSVTAAPIAYSVNSNGVNRDTSDRLHRIDLATGEVTALEKVRLNKPSLGSFSDIEGLAFGPDGTLYGVDDGDETLLTISTTTGIGASVTGNPLSLQLGQVATDFGLTFTCEGLLFMSSDINQTLYQVNDETGLATGVTNSPGLGASITALAAWGDKVYGLSHGRFADSSLTPSLYAIDVETGAATLIGALGNAVKLYRNAGLAFDEEGQLWAITDRFNLTNNVDFPSQVLKIDPATGIAEAISEVAVIGFESLAITGPMGCAPTGNNSGNNAVPIPVLNPLSILLMALVLLIVGGLNIRFKTE
ncbi:MAG: hypothetical protein L3J22_03845 [Xanthomonadales bacterium]|nr:hypothetical protein [Xanthomonadales bacterium]